MDVLDIFSRLDMRGKAGLTFGAPEPCQSCGMIKPSVLGKALKVCVECHTFIAEIAPRKRFWGAFYADENHAIAWGTSADLLFNGPSVTRVETHDWLAQSFDYLLNRQSPTPYVFALNTGKSVFSIDTMFINCDHDLIRISGPRQPVPVWRDGWEVRRSAVRAQQQLPEPDRKTVAGRFASIIRTKGLDQKSYTKSKELKAWNM